MAARYLAARKIAALLVFVNTFPLMRLSSENEPSQRGVTVLARSQVSRFPNFSISEIFRFAMSQSQDHDRRLRVMSGDVTRGRDFDFRFRFQISMREISGSRNFRAT